MNYHVTDIIQLDLTDDNLKDIINIKLYKIILFMELFSLNES